MAEECQGEYRTSLEEEAAKLKPEVFSTLSKRQQFCVNLRYGQLKLLKRLLVACTRTNNQQKPINAEAKPNAELEAKAGAKPNVEAATS